MAVLVLLITGIDGDCNSDNVGGRDEDDGGDNDDEEKDEGIKKF